MTDASHWARYGRRVEPDAAWRNACDDRYGRSPTYRYRAGAPVDSTAVSPRRVAVAVLAVFVGLAVAGCGGSGSDGSEGVTEPTRPGALPKPCTLLTPSDAEGLLGTTAQRVPGATTADRGQQCACTTTRASQMIMLRETNSVHVLSTGGSTTASTVDVGEQAYLQAGDPPGTSTLAFRSRGVVVSLLYSNVSADTGAGTAQDREDALVALGRRIASRL